MQLHEIERDANEESRVKAHCIKYDKMKIGGGSECILARSEKGSKQRSRFGLMFSLYAFFDRNERQVLDGTFYMRITHD